MVVLVYTIPHQVHRIQLSNDHIHLITIIIQLVLRQKVDRFQVVAHILVHQRMFRAVQEPFQTQQDTMVKSSQYHLNKLFDCLVQPPHHLQFLQIIIIVMVVQENGVEEARPVVHHQQRIK